VYHAKPIETNILKAIIIGTGICIAKNHWKENFFTLARQYPKGMFITKTTIVAIMSLVIIY